MDQLEWEDLSEFVLQEAVVVVEPDYHDRW